MHSFCRYQASLFKLWHSLKIVPGIRNAFFVGIRQSTVGRMKNGKDENNEKSRPGDTKRKKVGTIKSNIICFCRVMTRCCFLFRGWLQADISVSGLQKLEKSSDELKMVMEIVEGDVNRAKRRLLVSPLLKDRNPFPPNVPQLWNPSGAGCT